MEMDPEKNSFPENSHPGKRLKLTEQISLFVGDTLFGFMRTGAVVRAFLKHDGHFPVGDENKIMERVCSIVPGYRQVLNDRL